MNILGVDFTSAPSRRKPIVLARGQLDPAHARLRIEALERVESLPAFERALGDPRPCVGGFDFPFGLPREFLESSTDLPRTWLDSMRWLERSSRDALRERFRAFCAARPAGEKFAHRATDRVAKSSPSMKWVNPPVAFMMKEGVPRVVDAGWHIPGLHPGDERRIALEAYPALIARRVVGNASYKSDAAAARDPVRRERRRAIAEQLGTGALGLRVSLPAALHDAIVEDGRGDAIDAVLCAVQAAGALQAPRYGMPSSLDPLEGFIVGT